MEQNISFRTIELQNNFDISVAYYPNSLIAFQTNDQLMETYFDEKYLIFNKFKQNPYLFNLFENPLQSVSTFW